MTVHYDLYQNPPRNEDTGPTRLHARIIANRLIETERLAEEIQFASSVTEGDVHSVMAVMKSLIEKHLLNGNRIHLKGLGYFEMTLKCPAVENTQEIRAASVSFKSVAFRPETGLKKKLRSAVFVRAEYKNHSSGCTAAETGELLAHYFQSHTYITREEFQRLCGFTQTTAIRRLNSLLKEGRLKKGGIYKFPIYEPAELNY